MLFERSQTEVAVYRALERGSKSLTREMLTELLDVAMTSWKPEGYDAHQIDLRLRYEGRALALHRRARAVRYPATSVAMPDVNFNWMGLIAGVDASVYDYEPERFLVGADKQRLDDDDDSAVAFADLVRTAHLARVMPEVERRAMVAKTVFVRVRWRPDFTDEGVPLERGGRPLVEPYWPNDVYVIPHHTRPEDLSTCVALIARSTGPSSPQMSGEAGRLIELRGTKLHDHTWYEVWTRPVQENPDGSIARLGKWSVELANLKGESILPFGVQDSEYPCKRLPWAVYRAGIPTGCIFVDEDRDTALATDALNVNWANIVYVGDMQGHDQLLTAGHTVDKEQIAVGPDVKLALGPNETAQFISPNPKIEALLEVNKGFMRTLAVTRRQSPDAYATERGPPLTGVSRRIANEPQDKARRERAHESTSFEEAQLLPILLDTATYWGEHAFPDDVRPRMTPKDPPEFEDPEAKQRRSISARDARLIEDARAAVESGWYRNEEEARTALEKIEADKPKQSMLPFAGVPMSPAQRALEEAEGKPKPDDEEEDE